VEHCEPPKNPNFGYWFHLLHACRSRFLGDYTQKFIHAKHPVDLHIDLGLGLGLEVGLGLGLGVGLGLVLGLVSIVHKCLSQFSVTRRGQYALFEPILQ